MKKFAVYLALAIPLTFAALPASATSSSTDGMKSHKVTKHSAKHSTHKRAVQRLQPTTTGQSPAQDPIKKSMDDPKVYGKPDAH
jgi:hypothetical protein